jgi:hypothetical protein
MKTRDEGSSLHRATVVAAAVALSASAMLVSLISAPPASAVLPVDDASGYDYSAGEPAVLVSDQSGRANGYMDKACTGGYAVAGDSGFFLTTAQNCAAGVTVDGSVRGDAGYHADIYYSNPRDPLSLLLMRSGNDAHQIVEDPTTGKRPGSGLVVGWTRSVDQPLGYVIGKMGIDTGWTEGRVVGTAAGPNGTSLLCTNAPASIGDIGGPVWRSEGSGVRALGTVVGVSDKGGACYRPIQETLFQYGASLPSFGAAQGRPAGGTFAPGMTSYRGTVTFADAGRVLDKGADWRR